jgi:type 1 glutamine amidotransferase
MAKHAQRLALLLVTLVACGDNTPLSTHDGANEACPETVPRPEGHIDLTLQGEPGKPRVLVYTYENFWRHYSNIDCSHAILAMNVTRGFTVSLTNDPWAINAKNLANVDVVVFAITSGSGLDPRGQAELEAWIRAGGGVVGFHSASATESFWPFFVKTIGTTFAGHVNGLQKATVRIASSTHPITAGLPDIELTDEWYFFAQRPETIPGNEILLTLDEDTLPPDYPANNKQGYHPIGWAHEPFGGRVFYSAFGHAQEAWTDPTVLEITGRAIEWAAHQR